jgi:hypothetical protein
MGHMLGLVYSILCGAANVLLILNSVFDCAAGCTNSIIITITVISEIPVLLFNGIIIVWYIVAVVYHFIPIKKKGILKQKSDYHRRTVKYLLQKYINV